MSAEEQSNSENKNKSRTYAIFSAHNAQHTEKLRCMSNQYHIVKDHG